MSRGLGSTGGLVARGVADLGPEAATLLGRHSCVLILLASSFRCCRVTAAREDGGLDAALTGDAELLRAYGACLCFDGISKGGGQQVRCGRLWDSNVLCTEMSPDGLESTPLVDRIPNASNRISSQSFAAIQTIPSPYWGVQSGSSRSGF